MRARSCCAAFGSLVWIAAVSAQVQSIPDKVKPAIADAMQLPTPDRVHLDGMLGARIALSESARLLIVDEDEMLGGFRNRPGKQAWVGEHIGKWMHAATLAWAYTADPKLREKLDRVVGELLKTQGPDGYLGTYLEADRWKSWDVWVHKYDLIGLLTYYRHTGNPAALDACRRIGDILIASFGRDKRDITRDSEHVGMAAMSVMEPMVWLYRLTGDRKYLEFCEYILWAYELPHGPKLLSALGSGTPVNKTANAKAYEMLSNLVGLCEYYRTTGRRDLLPVVMNAWQDIVDKRLYITGSASQKEFFRDDYALPNDKGACPAENCVTVTWIQFNLQLLRITGESRFADRLEQTAYNHLSAAQACTGADWMYFTPLEGVREYGHYGRLFHCCLSSGPRGMALIPTFAYATDADGLVVNLYEAGTATLKLPDGTPVKLQQRTSMPGSEETVIRIGLQQPKRFNIRLRRPAWAEDMRVSYTREIPDHGKATEKGYRLDFAEWKDGDEIFIKFKMPVRVVKGEHNNAGRVAITRGPLVLSATQGGNGQAGDIREVMLPDSADKLAFRPLAMPTTQAARKGGGQWQVDACRKGEGGQIEKTTLRLLPFAEAGQDGTYYQVWLKGGCDAGK